MKWIPAGVMLCCAAGSVLLAWAAGRAYLSARCHLGSASAWCADAVPAFWMGLGGLAVFLWLAWRVR